MAKYHIKKDGTPGVCRAKGTCPLGGSESHFDSPEAAQAESQKRMEQQFGVVDSDQMNTKRTNAQYADDLVPEFSGEVSLYEVKLNDGKTFKAHLFNDKEGNLVELGTESNRTIPVSSIKSITQERNKYAPPVESVTNKAINANANNETVSFKFDYDTVRNVTIKSVDADGFIEYETEGYEGIAHASDINSIENTLDEKASSSEYYKNNPTVEFNNGKTTTSMKFKEIDKDGNYNFYDKNGKNKTIKASEVKDIRASNLGDKLLDSEHRDKSVNIKFTDGDSYNNVSYLYEEDGQYIFTKNDRPSSNFNIRKEKIQDIEIID